MFLINNFNQKYKLKKSSVTLTSSSPFSHFYFAPCILPISCIFPPHLILNPNFLFFVLTQLTKILILSQEYWGLSILFLRLLTLNKKMSNYRFIKAFIMWFFSFRLKCSWCPMLAAVVNLKVFSKRCLKGLWSFFETYSFFWEFHAVSWEFWHWVDYSCIRRYSYKVPITNWSWS